jgi:hypothetical protein
VLKPHDLDRRDPALVLEGRVLDEHGKPVPFAVVEPFGFGKGNGAQFGGLTGFDPLALTNDKGVFRLGVPEPGLSVYLQVNAPFMAPRNFAKLAVDTKHDLTLFTGVTLTGRLVRHGKPLAGGAVGAAQKSRMVDTFLGDFKIETDAKGVFRLMNLPPQEVLALYGIMNSLRPHGAVAAREVKTGLSGTDLNIGDLEVQPGYKLAGRVVLADGKPVPAGTQVMLSREDAWDTQQATVGTDGSFAFTGLPSEHYSLFVRVPGYHLSPKNASADVYNGLGLIGLVHADTQGLRYLLEPGPEPSRSGTFNQELYNEHNRRLEAPLRGAPPKAVPGK